MTISLKHAFVNPVADEGDPSLTGPDEWNAEHLLTQATSRILGRITAGPGSTEELTAAQVRTLLALGTAALLNSGTSGTSVPLLDGANSWSGAQTLQALLTTNGQIAFPASQNASSDPNTLDDYEEGTWTPGLTFATPGDFSTVLSAAVGIYQKVGKTVHAWFQITTSTFTYTTASGTLRFTGLPFTSAAFAGGNWRGLSRFSGFNKAGYTQINTTVPPSGTFGQFGASGMGVASSQIDAADAPSASTLNLSCYVAFQV